MYYIIITWYSVLKLNIDYIWKTLVVEYKVYFQFSISGTCIDTLGLFPD
jgi:hypothetical protein